MYNPYETMGALDVEGAIASISTFKERFAEVFADMRKTDIDPDMIAEFTALFDDIWGDTIDVSREFAEEALPFCKTYGGPDRADIKRDQRMAAE